MATLNLTNSNPDSFILVGIPGLEQFHVLIGIPFFSIYLVALVSNGILLYLITMDQSLHEPMFFFLLMLASGDLILFTISVPKTLGILWLKAQEITFSVFLTQLSFLHFNFFLNSAILLGMAFDCYMAIWYPLRYASVLMAEPGGLLTMGSHRVGHDWSDLAAAAAVSWHPRWLLRSWELKLCCYFACCFSGDAFAILQDTYQPSHILWAYRGGPTCLCWHLHQYLVWLCCSCDDYYLRHDPHWHFLHSHSSSCFPPSIQRCPPESPLYLWFSCWHHPHVLHTSHVLWPHSLLWPQHLSHISHHVCQSLCNNSTCTQTHIQNKADQGQGHPSILP